MKKIYVITSSKGGVAKTTNTIELAAALGVYGKKVLCIDLDQTAALSNSVLSINNDEDLEYIESIKTSYDLLLAYAKDKSIILDEVILDTSSDIGFDLIRGDYRFETIESILNPLKPGTNKILKKILEAIPDDMYDYIFIDHGPQRDILKTMAYVAADRYILTTKVDDNSINEARGCNEEIIEGINDDEYHGEIAAIICADNEIKAQIGKLTIDEMEEEAEHYYNARNGQAVRPKVFEVKHAVAIPEVTKFKIPNAIAHKSNTPARSYYEIADYILQYESDLF